MTTAKALIEQLNQSDECTEIEAKRGSEIDKSVLESVCAFANEPSLEGGHLLLGVVLDEQSLFPQYEVTGITNPDKLQSDLASQCGSKFNMPLRPEIEVEAINGLQVLKIFVPELPESQKPVYFKNKGLPKGAYRRIGSSDQQCTEDDLLLFYSNYESYDASILKHSSWADVDEEAIAHYRALRTNVNAYAEELNFNNRELLLALNCWKSEDQYEGLTVAGLLIFGTKIAQRRLMPALRLDYIRVPGNEWVPEPDERFTTVDMRGPLLLLVERAYNTIVDDLPKNFQLPEGKLQAEMKGLPGRVIREAIVNALMHRSYRDYQPIQIIRYSNRIEIINPGFSLKPEDKLGEPGSVQRNQFIAAVFHETNLAETKGSGIRTMQRLMDQADMVPPTFESDHGNNSFTTRLLLHHFLSREDIKWLKNFDHQKLTDNQKKALVFVREVGAIDNFTYRQLGDVNVLKASSELRSLRDKGLLIAKGKGRATYYLPGSELMAVESAPVQSESAPVQSESAPVQSESAPVQSESAPVQSESAPVQNDGSDSGQTHFNETVGIDEVPQQIREKILGLGGRTEDKAALKEIIMDLCRWRPLSSSEIAAILGRTEKYILRNFLTPMKKEGALAYTIPDMPNHPKQRYKTA